MDIVIKWGSNSLTLPVNPSEVMVGNSNNNSDVYIEDLGSINLKGKRGLWSISISSFFPCQPYDFSKDKSNGNTSYSKYINALCNLFNNNTTINLVVSGTNINLTCTISEFNYGHKDATMDVFYEITFTEFRSVKRTSIKVPKKKTVTWKKGFTWQSVTKKVLGSSSSWKTQRKNNASVIKKARKKPRNKNGVQSFAGTSYQFECWALQNYKVVIKE